MSAPPPHESAAPFTREVTVAHVREREGAPAVDAMFLESARIYKLRRDHPHFDRLLRQLRDALASRRVVQVTLAAIDSDEITDVR